MAEKTQFKINLSDLNDYVPYEGLGSADLFPQDGLFMLLIEKGVASWSEDDKGNKKNPKITFVLIAQDDDAKPRRTIRDVLVGGVDKDGKKLIRQLGELLSALGMNVEEIRKLSGETDSDVIIAQVVGKVVPAEMEAERYQGRMTSKVRNFVTKERYETAKAANAHRKPHKAEVSFTSAPTGVIPSAGMVGPVTGTGLNLGGGNGATAPIGLATPATDPLRSLGGLGLRA